MASKPVHRVGTAAEGQMSRLPEGAHCRLASLPMDRTTYASASRAGYPSPVASLDRIQPSGAAAGTPIEWTGSSLAPVELGGASASTPSPLGERLGR